MHNPRRLGIYGTDGKHIADFDLDAMSPENVYTQLHHYALAGPIVLVLLPKDQPAPPEYHP